MTQKQQRILALMRAIDPTVLLIPPWNDGEIRVKFSDGRSQGINLLYFDADGNFATTYSENLITSEILRWRMTHDHR